MNGLLNCYSSSESEDSDLYKSSESEEEDQVNQQINKKKAKSGICELPKIPRKEEKKDDSGAINQVWSLSDLDKEVDKSQYIANQIEHKKEAIRYFSKEEEEKEQKRQEEIERLNRVTTILDIDRTNVGMEIIQYKDVEKGKKKDTTKTVEQKKHPQQEKVRANV